MTAEEMSETSLEIILKFTNLWPTLSEEKKAALTVVIGCPNAIVPETSTIHSIIWRIANNTTDLEHKKILFCQLLNSFAEKSTESLSFIISDKNDHSPISLDDPRKEMKFKSKKKKTKQEKKAKKRKDLISRFNALTLFQQMAVLRRASKKIDRKFNLMERTDGTLGVTRQVVSFHKLRSVMKVVEQQDQKTRDRSRSRSRSR